MKNETGLAGLQRALTAANRPFVSYRLPEKQRPFTVFGPDSFQELPPSADFLGGNNGFVIAPYDDTRPLLWLEAQHTIEGFDAGDHWTVGLAPVNSTVYEPDTNFVDRPGYLLRLEEAIRNIRAGRADKIVISRRILQQWPDGSLQAVQLFRHLCLQYPSAFVYLANIPGKGLWAGASPEVLLESCDGRINTMSLSGTRKRQEVDTAWGQKEMDEHTWVSRYIAETIRNCGCSNLTVSPMHTVAAAWVEHLRTLYSADCDSSHLYRLVHALHPTPAVCGWPTPSARKFIAEIEKYDRSFYTGFLGPVSNNGSFNLFVNLRCMNILNDQVIVYVGGGITKDSDPETEWEETLLKSRTMLAAIENLGNFAG
jgi:isochorismate synthase